MNLRRHHRHLERYKRPREAVKQLLEHHKHPEAHNVVGGRQLEHHKRCGEALKQPEGHHKHLSRPVAVSAVPAAAAASPGAREEVPYRAGEQ
jgi:hypothetical protein